MRARDLAALFVLAVATAAAEDPLADATDAYRKGDFSRAAKSFAAAAQAESDPAKRAEIRVKLAATYYAMKNRPKTEEALAGALRDAPQLELVAEFYTEEFIATFDRVKARLASPPPTAGAPSIVRGGPSAQIASVRSRLAQAPDNPAIETLLGEAQQLEAAVPLGTLPEVLDLEAEALDRLGRTSDALEKRGRVAALRASAQAGPGASTVPLDALLEGRKLIATGHPEDAAALMHGVIAAQPSCVPALEVLGEALLDAGRLDEASNTIRTAILSNEKPDLLLALGEVELKRSRLPSARDAFRRAAEIDPSSDRAWAGLGLLAARLEDLAAAHDALDRAIQANGTLFEARVVRAQLALAEGQMAAAISHLQRALQIRPEDPWALGWMGIVLLANGDGAAALEKLQAAKPGPDSAFALALAEALRRDGKVGEAFAILASRTKDDANSRLLRARCLLDVQKPAEAAPILQQLAAQNPQDARVRYLVGYAGYAQRSWRQASEDIARAASMPGAPAATKDAATFSAATLAAQELMDSALTPPPAPPAR